MRSIWRHLLTVPVLFLVFQCNVSHAAEPKPSRATNQVDITVVHVDKYGVYAPNAIFYWDTSMSKSRISSLISTAEKLRNKRAIVTYSSQGELANDKRPLIVDIIAYKEEPRKEQETIAAEENQISSLDRTNSETGTESEEWEEPEREALKQAPYSTNQKSGTGSNSLEEDNSRTALQEPGWMEQAHRARLGEDESEQAAATPAITRQEVTDFVRLILSLNEQKDLSGVLSYYSEQVNYYTRGIVDKDYIRKDMRYYYRNWDKIDSRLQSDVVLIVTDEKDVRIAKFVSSFSVKNSKKCVSGRSENIWKIRRVGRDLKIEDVKQRIISSESYQQPAARTVY